MCHLKEYCVVGINLCKMYLLDYVEGDVSHPQPPDYHHSSGLSVPYQELVVTQNHPSANKKRYFGVEAVCAKYFLAD